MRTIVPFVLSFAIAGALSAQPGVPPQIDFLEKRIAAGSANVQQRVTLMNLYLNARNVEKRREQVLWLAEHNPEIPNFRNPPFNLGPDGPLPDAAGLEQEAAIWRTIAGKPDSRPAALANAAWFFRLSDRPFGWSVLRQAEVAYPNDPEIAKARGALDAADVLGPDISVAAKARAEIEASNDARLIAAAADALTQPPFNFLNTTGPTFEERFDIAEKWLLRAREMQPENREMKAVLGRVYQTQAGQSADPRWKVELFRKADALIENWPGLAQLAMAEYDAAEDDAALKTAQRMLDRKPAQPLYVNVAHTVLGLVALDQKRVDVAKAELFESARITANIEPNRTLAQALVDAGERDAVLQYFDMCRAFWKGENGAIDYYMKMVRSPGQHDIVTRYFAGQGVRGRPAPQLPIDNYAGKPIAVQFRNAACKECAREFETLDKAATKRGVVDAWIDVAGHEALVRQMEVQSFPTVVLIDADGRVVDFLTGHIDENVIDNRMGALSPVGRTLTAPAVIGPFAWKPVPGAESYVVQWDQRDERGWLSDRDEHLVRVIPTHETTVELDPKLGENASSPIRWRVFAVNRFGAGKPSGWNETAPKVQ